MQYYMDVTFILVIYFFFFLAGGGGGGGGGISVNHKHIWKSVDLNLNLLLYFKCLSLFVQRNRRIHSSMHISDLDGFNLGMVFLPGVYMFYVMDTGTYVDRY